MRRKALVTINGVAFETSPLLASRRASYISTLKEKLLEEDWHGVMDFAADLREVDVTIKVINAGRRLHGA